MSDYEKLVGSGTAGKELLEAQGSAQGFKNVSQYWLPKTLTYEQAFEKLEQGRQSREDILCTMKQMLPIVAEDGKFALAYDDGREFILDEWSASQFFQKIGVPVTVYNWLTEDSKKPNGDVKVKRDAIDARLLVSCVKNGLRHIDADKKFRFRTYDNSVIRAVLTEDYKIIDNRWYLEVMKECIPGGRVSHWRGNADTVFSNILIPDSIREEKDSEYGGMVSIGNCEIGKRRLSQTPSVFRAICMNGCIWSQKKGKNINRVHRGKDIANLSELKREIARNIQEQIPLVSIGITKLLQTQKFNIKLMKNFIAEVCNSWGFKPNESREVVSQFSKHESAHRNLFGVINSITRAGQELDNNRWVEFDEFAGELTGATEDWFERTNKRAENLSDEMVASIFGV